jgi:hypothetical protein
VSASAAGDASAGWADEIRAYLLGRLGRDRQRVPVPLSSTARLVHAPIRRWWTLEGKHYTSIGGTLAQRWAPAIRAMRALLLTHNPRIRIAERPEGMVDWPRTLARGPTPVAEYVVRGSGVGLDDDEYDAAVGWSAWIAREWSLHAERFASSVAAPDEASARTLETWKAARAPATTEQLWRWAHTARRSRWPVLRDVVAESLRTVLERDDVDHVPLPTDRARLFELVCLVRIAKSIAPPSDELRWLDRELTENRIELRGATCWYQQHLARESVLRSPDYGEGLAEAAELFRLRVPSNVDLAFEFDRPRGGLDGMIVEAKSGAQGFDAAVPQLRAYRRARPRRPGSRYLVWGVVETQPLDAPLTPAQLDAVRRTAASGTGDVWMFSGAASIPDVLNAVGLDFPLD